MDSAAFLDGRRSGVEPELMQIATAASGELVRLLVTDSWERAKTAVGGVWRRVHPDRADVVESDLAEAHHELVAALGTGNGQVEQLLLAEWRGRFWRLLAANPELAAEIQLMTAREFQPAGGSSPGSPVSMDARVDGGGSVFQAGRDQTITVDMGRDRPTAPRIAPRGDGW
jgi:hypothetical protein